jgi:hypothetical protein
MSQQDTLTGWLPMSEVVARTGMSERTIYRKVTEGQLIQAQKPMPGRRPLPLFDPGSVAEVMASAFKPRANARQKAIPPGDESAERDGTGSFLPPSELSFKLYLTEDEAIRYTGFGRAFLRTHGKGKPIGPHGSTVYRRVELEKL